ncbi:MAG: hypothetical protein WA364_10280 [Candidatus Nitrosopolaris sp.]
MNNYDRLKEDFPTLNVGCFIKKPIEIQGLVKKIREENISNTVLNNGIDNSMHLFYSRKIIKRIKLYAAPYRHTFDTYRNWKEACRKYRRENTAK